MTNHNQLTFKLVKKKKKWKQHIICRKSDAGHTTAVGNVLNELKLAVYISLYIKLSENVIPVLRILNSFKGFSAPLASKDSLMM